MTVRRPIRRPGGDAASSNNRATAPEQRFRKMVLALDGVVEQSHMNHPDFRVGGRIFATLRGDGRHGMVSLTPEQQAEFVARWPDAFSPEAGAWGRSGSTRVVLDAVDGEALGEALSQAWQNRVQNNRRRR